MKTLVYENRKISPIRWDISTPEKRDKAFLELFKILDEEWQCYCEFEKGQKVFYNQAKKGNAEAAEKLLSLRVKYEYEEWKIVNE